MDRFDQPDIQRQPDTQPEPRRDHGRNTMLSRRTFLRSAAALTAAPAVLRSAFAQTPEFTLKLHHLLGPKAPAQTKMLEPWAQGIEKDSGGRIKIDIYPAMSL